MSCPHLVLPFYNLLPLKIISNHAGEPDDQVW